MTAPDPEVVSRHPAAQWKPNRKRLLAALQAREAEDEGESDRVSEDDSVDEAQPLPWSPHAPVAQSDRATAS